MLTQAHHGPLARNVDNKTMFSLMFSYLLLIIALQSTLYVWSSLITVLLVLWRFLYQQKKTSLPTRGVLNILAVAVCTMVVFSSLTSGILDGMTNLLLLGAAMKLLAIHSGRSVRHLTLALYFTIASAFIFNQGIAFTSLVLFIFVLNTYTLLMVHSPGLNFKTRSGYAARFVLTALPLIVFLFALMPRFGPLWKMPSATGTSTGLSEEISPGDFASLTQSSKLAFRVQFDHEIPDNNRLYWRAMIHERFDGKQWSVDRIRKAPQNNAVTEHPSGQFRDAEKVQYRVIAEPSYQDWVFALDTPIEFSGKLRYHHDRRLSALTPVTQKFEYTVTSASKHQDRMRLTPLEKQINLLLPRNHNKRTIELAQKLWSESTSDIDYISKVMGYFVDNQFVYTLEPPLMPLDPVDTFLFDARAGFCAHYASAFAVLMRAAGLPARVVSGYQGGERSDDNAYLSVYQYAAHAWDEVYLPNQGWVRFDPTSVVSPERIALGLQAALKDKDSFLQGEFSLAKFRQFALLNWLRNQLNNIDFYWSSWILNFDSSKQKKLFESIWGQQDRVMYGLYSGLALVGFLLFVYFLSRGRLFEAPHSAVYRTHQELIAVAKRYGFQLNGTTAPITFARRFAQFRPELAPQLDTLSEHYSVCLYQPVTAQAATQALGSIQRIVKTLKRGAPSRLKTLVS